ncbi:hypothetical protein LZG71_26300, partial [Dyadobacter sp. CY312]|nr:hypothetical protein [Dyadobacter sp. CY312]
MKRTFIKKGFLACIITLLAAASSFAQTITTGAVTPAAVCAGESISVPFTPATIPAGTSYTVQISNASGVFTTPIATATGTASPISVLVPSTAVGGAGYKARVISVTPAVTGTESAAFTVNAIPAAPVVVTPLNYTVGQTANLQATALTGATLNWYGTSATGGTSTAIKPVPSTATPGTEKYYVSQTIGTCESPRSEIVVNVTAACTTPAAPVVVTPLNYTVGQTANLQATALTGATLNWYGTSATGGTSTTTKPVPSTTTPGMEKYYVSQTIGTCESPRSEIVVNVAAVCATPAPVVVT